MKLKELFPDSYFGKAFIEGIISIDSVYGEVKLEKGDWDYKRPWSIVGGEVKGASTEGFFELGQQVAKCLTKTLSAPSLYHCHSPVVTWFDLVSKGRVEWYVNSLDDLNGRKVTRLLNQGYPERKIEYV